MVGTLTCFGGVTVQGGSKFSTVGFNGANPIAKQNVTGSAGASSALASVLAVLEAYGLINDNSTP
jgi:hypothetical protein